MGGRAACQIHAPGLVGTASLGDLLAQGAHIELLAGVNAIWVVDAVDSRQMLGQAIGLGAVKFGTHGVGLLLHDAAEGVASSHCAAKCKSCRRCCSRLRTLQCPCKRSTGAGRSDPSAVRS